MHTYTHTLPRYIGGQSYADGAPILTQKMEDNRRPSFYEVKGGEGTIGSPVSKQIIRI